MSLKHYEAAYYIDHTRLIFLRVLFSSVIDIWSLQPQPHLQPQATLRGHPPTAVSSTQEDGPLQSTDQTSRTSRPTSSEMVSKRWGEVVVNPNKKRSRQNMKERRESTRDVFGVLKVN